jgi:hypothetical protein
MLRRRVPPMAPQPRSSVPAMDIEEFYDANEQRRESEEHEFGAEWRDAAGNVYELNFVVDTGEVYFMAMPGAEMIEDPFGDIAVDQDEPIEDLTVEVIAVVPTTDELHQAIAGWEQEMTKPASVEWVRAAVRDYPVT